MTHDTTAPTTELANLCIVCATNISSIVQLDYHADNRATDAVCECCKNGNDNHWPITTYVVGEQLFSFVPVQVGNV